MKLQYDEARKQVSQMQEELAAIENQMIPGQNESDKERLLLIQEKDQLLRELRSISPKGRAEEEMEDIRGRCWQLECDLKQAVQVSNQQIAERLKLNEAKSDVVKRLKEATQLTTHLESHLKSLSLSTLSMSSGSSRGSLGSLSASSKGSLSSLNYSDIYSQKSTSPDVSLCELHHRVEKLLQGHTTCISPIREIVGSGSTENIAAEAHGTPPGEANPELSCPMYRMSPGSSVSSLSSQLSSLSLHEGGPPPSYEQHLERQRHNGCVDTASGSDAITGSLQHELNVPAVVRSVNGGCMPVYISRRCQRTLPVACWEVRRCAEAPMRNDLISSSDLSINPPLSPISESSSGVCNNLSGGNTRSVSAAVSDESVAGDSGVYEAAIKRSGALDESLEMALECAQVQIKLKYEGLNGELHIGIEQARNLAALAFTEHSQVCIKAALLPSRSYVSFCTQRSRDLRHPKFNQTFCVSIAECKLESKTLQVHIWSVNESNEEECLGCAQVSLASFDPRHISIEWYNVLSFKFMQSESSASSGSVGISTASTASTSTAAADKVEQLLQASSMQLRQTKRKGEDKRGVSDGCLSREGSGKSGRESRESMGTMSCHSSVASCQKEESSDESTIISSRTSTLTRSQGPDDMDRQEGVGSQVGGESGEDEEEERDRYLETNELVIREPHDLLRVDEGSNEDKYSQDDDLEVATCDKETNTGVSIRRSQTFSPLGRPGCDYRCKLNRSDSDSSVKYRRGPFQRSAIERRSLRFKKLSTSRSLTPADCSTVSRTSIDLELDFQASQTRLSQLNDEIAHLKDLKRRFEEMKARGDGEPPEWFTENEKLQHFLTEADKLLARHEKRTQLSRVDEKAEKYLRKVMREVKQLPRGEHDQPEVLSFRRKMAFFTSVNMNVPVILSESESETDDADEDMKCNCQTVPATTTTATTTTTTTATQHKTSANKYCCSDLPNTKV
ncbi:Protein kibra [Lamellibrachia satsuma]|nr:Protein kibra [Lamellibrachia satsuma]